jgi:alpha-galactosidase
MTDLALEPDLGGIVSLYDTDAAAAQSNKAIGGYLSKNPGALGKWEYITSSSLEEALRGADFVIISILPGTFDEMESDVHLPERLGILQPVGDTAGPGGIVRALRTIPMFIVIAEAIKNFAPEAWVINYTNPMSLCVRALYHVYPDMKAFGCCHEVFGTQELLAAVAGEELGIKDAMRSQINVNVLGINHFTWFSKASLGQQDLFPVYESFIAKNYEKGYLCGSPSLINQRFTCLNKVKFDLFRRYGWIAAAGDRHLAEFMPGSMYLKDLESVRSWGFYLTGVDWRKEDLKARLLRSKALSSGEESMELKSSGEEGILLIKALCGLTRVISNVNLPNYGGQISNIPKCSVVETNAVFSLNDIRPVYAGSFTEEIGSLMKPHIDNQETVLNAALTGDRAYVYEAFSRDPLTAGRCSFSELKALADEMIKNTMAFLPDIWN